MQIATRLWLSISILMIGYFLTVAIGWWLSLSAEAVLRRVGECDFGCSLLSQRAEATFLVEAQGYQDGVVEGQMREIDVAHDAARTLSGLLASIIRLEPDDSGMALTESLLARHRRFAEEAQGFYPQMMVNPTEERWHERADRLHDETSALKAGFASLKDALAEDLHRNLGSTIADSQERRRWRLAIFLVIATVSIGLALYLIAQLNSRLRALVLASERLSRGEFGTEVSDTRRDEIGALASSFDAMRLAVRARDLDLRTLNGSLEETVRARTLELSQRNRDLTQEVRVRVRAEESLRLLESAVTQTTDAVVIAKAADGASSPGIVYVNPAFTRMFGYSADDIAERPLITLGGDSESLRRITTLQAAAGAGQAGFHEIESTSRDGSRRMTEWRIGPIRERDGGVSHLVATLHDISARKRAEAELHEVQLRLLEASRQAGQAEVATGVLHNVGNVLNSINVSAAIVSERVARSRCAGLAKTVALLESQGEALPAWLAADGQRQRVLGYLGLLAGSLAEERSGILVELESLTKNIDHVKDVVGMQQAYARSSGFAMLLDPRELMEDALRMQESSLDRQRIAVERDYEDLPQVLIDKHRTLQILINLVSNAKHALDAREQAEHRIRVSVRRLDPGRLAFAVSDNGVGIAPELIERIFAHGFTTRPDGHGFGLHSSALAAQEMHGSLAAASAGPGLGATFTLELPVRTEYPCPSPA